MKKNRFGNIKWLILFSIGSILAMGIYNSVTYKMGQLVDFAVAKDMELMLDAGKYILIVVSMIIIFNTFTAYLNSMYRKRSMEDLKKRYIDKLLALNVKEVQKDKIPVMLSQLTNDFDRYESKFIDKVSDLVSQLSQFITSTILLGFVNKYLVLAAIAMLIVFGYTSKGASKPIKATEEKKSKSLNNYTEFINETFLGFEIIKQHQLEPKREAEFVKNAIQVQNDNYQVDKKSTHVEAFNGFTINTILYTIVIVGMYVASTTQMSLGNVIVIFSAFSNIMWPIRSITPVISEMAGISNLLDSMDDTLKNSNEIRSNSISAFESLSFTNADLGYEDGVILTDVNIEVKRGEKVLIIGPSGAGKSTILKTLRQSITPTSGSVKMNGIDINSINILDYYSKFSIVDQVGFLFDGSIVDNVTLYQDVDATKVRLVLDKIGLKDLMENSEVQNDGNNMSGGQRARIMLARALTLNAEIIMCDEIFASLDMDIAKSIEKDMLKFENTILNVSHIMFEEHLELYNKIYIVEDGSVRLASDIDEVKLRMLEYSA